MTYHDPKLSRAANPPESVPIGEDRLIEDHLPLVRKLAWQAHRRAWNVVEIEDLLQIGMLALVEAALGYEDRGLGFSSYAKLRVRGAMIDYLRKSSHLSRSAMQFRKKLRFAQAKLSQSHGHDPGAMALADEMDMDLLSFRIAMDNSAAVDLKSMDEMYTDHSRFFEDQSETADNVAERRQMHSIVAEAIAQLDGREAEILELYFGKEMNLVDIGHVMGISAARVCQIKKSALHSLNELIAVRLEV